MKKVFLIIFAMAAIAVVTGKYFNKRSLVSDLFFENIEALAAGEGDHTICVAIGNVTCPSTGDKVAYTLTPYNLE
ncbi:NVEALA domain-containing protein [Phocaeicola sp.]